MQVCFAALEADYSTTRVYSLRVLANDGTVSTTVTVSVFVEASNANPPVCTAPTDSSVPETTAVNSLITTLSCSDADDGGTPEGMIRYSMTGGDGFFSIGAQSGNSSLYLLLNNSNLIG